VAGRWFEIVVGVAIAGLWLMLLATRQVSSDGHQRDRPRQRQVRSASRAT
jgi:hypothetical protein